MVGTYEYSQALEHLQPLIASSTTEEIAIYDAILRDRPEFSFYGGMSRLPGMPQELQFPDRTARQKFDDEFLRQGLASMLALAKIELGATVSMYGQVQRPFEIYPPNNFDLATFLQLLADDAVAHMKSLAQEAGFKEVVRPSYKVDTWTLAYLRRLKLIRDMLDVLFKTGNPEVEYRMRPLDKELKKYTRRLIEQVYIQDLSVTLQNQQTTSGSTSNTVTARSNQECADFVQRMTGGNR